MADESGFIPLAPGRGEIGFINGKLSTRIDGGPWQSNLGSDNKVITDGSDPLAGFLDSKVGSLGSLIVSSKSIQPPLDMAWWMKSDELGINDGDSVQVVNVPFAGSSDLVQSDSTKQPVYKAGSSGVNGLGVIHVSNVAGNNRSSFLTGTIDTSGWSGFTAYVVARTGSDLSSQSVFGGVLEIGANGGPSWWNIGFGHDGTDGAGWGGHNGLVDFHGVDNFAHNTVFYGRWGYDKHTWKLDGVSSNTFTDTAFPAGTQQISVGSANYPGAQFDGDVCEILLYGRTLSDVEDLIVKSYLRHKWGMDSSAVPKNVYFDLNQKSSEFSLPLNVVRVSPFGNDAWDGRYVTSPVRSVSTGIARLQALGGGTLEIEDGSWANSISGLGVLLYGTADHAHTTPGGSVPIGYTFCSRPMRVVGLAGRSFAKGTQSTVVNIMPGGGASDFTGPVLDLAGTFAPLHFSRILFYKDNESGVPAVSIGYSLPPPAWDAGTNYGSLDYSVTYGGHAYQVYNHDVPTGMPPIGDPSSATYWKPCRTSLLNSGANARAVAYSANIVFEQCGFRRDGLHYGPCIDVGSSFWIWYEHCGFVAPLDGTSPFTDAAVRFATTSAGFGYLQFFYDVQFSGGGVYCYGGGNGQIIQATNEDAGNLFLCEPAADMDFSSGSEWYISCASGEDSGTSCVSNFSAGRVIAERCTGLLRGYLKVIDPNLAGVQPGTGIADNFLYGESNFVSLMQHDAARRGYAPVAAAFPNVSYQPNPAAVTFVTAPDGTNTATVSGLGNEFIIFDEGAAAQTLVDGDRVIFGSWIRFDASSDGRGFNLANGPGAGGDLTFFYGGTYAGANQQATYPVSRGTGWRPNFGYATAQWVWAWGWCKIVTHGAGKLLIQIAAGQYSATDGAVWRPYAGIIPASRTDISDAEVAYYAINAQASAGYRSNAGNIVSPAVGSLPLWKGQKWAFWDETLQTVAYLDIDNGAIRIT